MTELSAPDESLGSFRLEDAHEQDAAQLAMILDLLAAKPAIQTLKAWALEQLDPRPGETAADIGSGTGEDVADLAARVSPGGRAVGVEPSPGLRAEAARRTDGLEFVDGDVLSLPFEDEAFDLIRCERVLQHISEPSKAVAEMVRVLKPGGRIALIDTDWSTAILHPVDPDVYSRIVGIFFAEAANPYSGRTLRGLLAETGLTITGETAATWIEPQEGGREGFVAMLGQRAAAAGAITQAEADVFRTGITEAADRGAFHLSVTMYAASAIKGPAA